MDIAFQKIKKIEANKYSLISYHIYVFIYKYRHNCGNFCGKLFIQEQIWLFEKLKQKNIME